MEMDAGDLEAAPFSPCSAVVLAELDAASRRSYLELLAARETTVGREGGGLWVANLRILAPGLVGPAKAVAPVEAEGGDGKKKKSMGPGKGVERRHVGRVAEQMDRQDRGDAPAAR